MTRTRTNGWWWRVMAVATIWVVVASGCGSPAPTVEAGPSAESGADEATQVWSDDVVAVVRALEAEQATLAGSVDPSAGTSKKALEVLQGNHASLKELSSSLPEPVSGEGLLATRYVTFTESLVQLELAAQSLVGPPPDGSQWRFGESQRKYSAVVQDVSAACFALQETMASDELGVLGCVGLTEAVDAALAIFDSQAAEGLEIFVNISSETGDIAPEFGPTRDRFTLNVCGMMNRDPLGLEMIDTLAAATKTLRFEKGDSIAVLETWVFPNRDMRDEAEESLNTISKSQKECLMDGPLFTAVWTDSAIDRRQYGPFELFTQISGFVHPELDTSEGPAFYQVGWAGEYNVLSIYSGAGRGVMPSEAEIAEAIGIAVVAGTRPPS